VATYFTSFVEYENSLIPSDWTARWDATTQFAVEPGGDDKVLRAILSANNRHLCTWDDIDTDADRDDVEILTKIKTGSVSDGISHAGVLVRGSGADTTKTGYALYIFGNDLSIAKYVNNVYSLIQTADLTLLADTWYWMRFRVNGTSLKARIWANGSSEPGTWTIDSVTDSSISGTGFVGAIAFDSAADPSYDQFGIGTNGDTAPSAPAAGIRTSTDSLLFADSVSTQITKSGATLSTRSSTDKMLLRDSVATTITYPGEEKLMATWPASLPQTALSNYGINPVDQTARTDMEVGAARVRRRTADRIDMINVEWSFTDAQMATFRSWFDNDAHGGAAWFVLSISTGDGGLDTPEVRFNGPWKSALVGAGMDWVVTASLEVNA
jgi:hypothetical protein